MIWPWYPPSVPWPLLSLGSYWLPLHWTCLDFQLCHFLQGLHKSPSLIAPQFLYLYDGAKTTFLTGLLNYQAHQCLAWCIIPSRLLAHGDDFLFPQKVVSLCLAVS